MTLALYRRYRPATFAEVIGQEHVTGPLSQAIRSGKVHHAYLFSGPRGCGKTSSARILARSLNCAEGPTPTPCGVCDSCVALAPNGPGSLDVIEIDAASHGLVDDARDLRERAFFAPVNSRFKVYIIDEAHMVTTAAFNALLKLVEEPPPHIKFVFATTEPDRVLHTIKSRTHHYPFRLVPPRELLGHLQAICTAEDVKVDPLVLPLVVRAGAGSVRDALSVLDQLLAGAGADGLTYPEAMASLGYTDTQLLDEVVDALAAGSGSAVFELVDRVIESGHEPRRFVEDLLERFRDLIVVSAVPDAVDKGLIDAPADQLDRLRSQAGRFGSAELSRSADVLNAGLTEMRGATAPRLLLELICARLLLPAAAGDLGSLAARLDRLERRLDIAAPGSAAWSAAGQRAPAPGRAAPASGAGTGGGSGPSGASTGPSSAPAGAPAKPEWPQAARVGGAGEAEQPPPAVGVGVGVGGGEPTGSAPGELDVDAVRRIWPDILDAVKQHKRTAHVLLSGYAQVAAVRGKTLVLTFSTEPLRRQFAGSVNEDVLVQALAEVLGVQWRVEAVTGGEPTSPGSVPDDTVPTAVSGGPAGGERFTGFAPGDDAADEDPDSPALPPEQAAVALLQQGLGAKVIGEIDAG